MTNAELQKVVEDLGDKLVEMAELQKTTFNLVNTGIQGLLLSSQALLQIAQSHERRINRLEGGEEEGS